MSLYQHFHPSEKPFIDLAQQWIEAVLRDYYMKLTPFLDPREQHILQTLVNAAGLFVAYNGGQAEAERKRAIIYPDYYTPQEADYELVIYDVRYAKKFVTLSHRELLGSAMALGLKREQFGDIWMNDDQFQLVVAREMAPYVEANFTQAGRKTIELQSTETVLPLLVTKEQLQTTISSLRLDAVVATIFRLSRQKAQLLVEAGHVKLNYKVEEHGATNVKTGDLLSVRKHGRAYLVEVLGQTKKEKWRVTIEIVK